MPRPNAPVSLLLLAALLAAAWFAWRSASAPPPNAADDPTVADVGTPGARPDAATAATQRESATPASDAPATGQPPGDDPSAVPTDSPAWRPWITVHGTVVAADDERPVAGAVVARRVGDTEPVTSDEQGEFAIAVVFDEAGVDLIVTHDDYLEVRPRVAAGDVIDEEARVVVTMEPNARAGRVRGTFVDDAGQPVAGCEVHLESDAGRDAGVRCESGDDGAFALDAVPPGRWTLAARSPRHDDLRLDGVRVEPGGDVDLGAVTLRRFGWAELRGTVVDADGRAIGGVAVSARYRHRDDVGTHTDRDGAFVVPRAAPGAVVVWFEVRDQWIGWRRLELGPNDVHTVDVRVPTGPHFVGGRVTVGGQPAAGFTADCETPGDALTGTGLDMFNRSQPVGDDGRFRFDGLAGRTAALSFTRARPWVSHVPDDEVATDRIDHEFAFDDVTAQLVVSGYVRDGRGQAVAGATVSPPDAHDAKAHGITGADGRYRIELQGTAHASTSLQARAPGFLPSTRHLVLASDNGPPTLDFTLWRDADAAEVRVVATSPDGPVARAAGILRDANHANFLLARTDDRGAFTRRLAPGDWSLRVVHPDFSRAETKFSLAPGERREVALSLEPLQRVTCTVEVRTTPDQPLPGVEVTAWRRGGWAASATTDALGRATLSGLPAGELEFSAEPDGHARHEVTVTVTGDDPAPVLLQLVPGLATASGLVLRADGTAAAHCEILCEALDGAIDTFSNCDERGAFRVERLPPGRYRLRAWTPDGTADAELVVPTDGAPGPVTIRFE